jgi:hypothetical protein
LTQFKVVGAVKGEELPFENSEDTSVDITTTEPVENKTEVATEAIKMEKPSALKKETPAPRKPEKSPTKSSLPEPKLEKPPKAKPPSPAPKDKPSHDVGSAVEWDLDKGTKKESKFDKDGQGELF